jgi:hypothetical protein
MTSIKHNMYPIKVKFRKGLVVLFLTMGSILFLTQISFFFIEDIRVNYISLFSSVMILFVGYRYYKGIYFEVTETKIEIKNIYGNVYKQYEYSGLEKLYYSNNKIFLEKNNGGQKTRLSKLMANQNDWNVLKNEILQNDFGQELHEGL